MNMYVIETSRVIPVKVWDGKFYVVSRKLFKQQIILLFSVIILFKIIKNCHIGYKNRYIRTNNVIKKEYTYMILSMYNNL